MFNCLVFFGHLHSAALNCAMLRTRQWPRLAGWLAGWLHTTALWVPPHCWLSLNIVLHRRSRRIPLQFRWHHPQLTIRNTHTHTELQPLAAYTHPPGIALQLKHKHIYRNTLHGGMTRNHNRWPPKQNVLLSVTLQLTPAPSWVPVCKTASFPAAMVIKHHCPWLEIRPRLRWF